MPVVIVIETSGSSRLLRPADFPVDGDIFRAGYCHHPEPAVRPELPLGPEPVWRHHHRDYYRYSNRAKRRNLIEDSISGVATDLGDYFPPCVLALLGEEIQLPVQGLEPHSRSLIYIWAIQANLLSARYTDAPVVAIPRPR